MKLFIGQKFQSTLTREIETISSLDLVCGEVWVDFGGPNIDLFEISDFYEMIRDETLIEIL